MRAIRKAERELERLVVAYRGHGCTDDEIEAMSSVIRVRRELEFQRLRREVWVWPRSG